MRARGAQGHLLNEGDVALRPRVDEDRLLRRLAALALWVEINADVVEASPVPVVVFGVEKASYIELIHM